MDNIAFVFCFGLAMLGHIALWTFLFNRLHTINWPRAQIKLLEKVIGLAVLLGGAALWWF